MNYKSLIINTLILSLLFGVIAQMFLLLVHNDRYDVQYSIVHNYDINVEQIKEDVLFNAPNVQVTEVNNNSSSTLNFYIPHITQSQIDTISSVINDNLNPERNEINVNTKTSILDHLYKSFITLVALMIGGILGILTALFTNNKLNHSRAKTETIENEGKVTSHRTLSHSNKNVNVIQNNQQVNDKEKLKSSQHSNNNRKEMTFKQIIDLNQSLRNSRVKKLLLTGLYNDYNSGQFAMLTAFQYAKLKQNTLILNFDHRYSGFLQKYYKNKSSKIFEFEDIIKDKERIEDVVVPSIYKGVNFLDYNKVVDPAKSNEVFISYVFQKLKSIEHKYDNILILAPEISEARLLNEVEKHVEAYLTNKDDEQHTIMQYSPHQLKKIQLKS